MYLAHISEDGREQTVEAHLRETAALCGGFCRSPHGERGLK